MTEIGFYHLQRSPLADALPRLLEKAVAAGHRAVVRAPDAKLVEQLDLALWTFNQGSFLPHGVKGDEWPEEQPVYLTDGEENPNGAEILFQVGGCEAASLGEYKRCLDLIDGNDPEAVAAARARWKRYLAQGHALTYWQQRAEGGWEKKA
jgi:DNA polymerase III subunit chi